MMASPFVSKHLVPDGVRFWPLFSNFCEHFVSIIRPSIPFSAERLWREISPLGIHSQHTSESGIGLNLIPERYTERKYSI
jgi:hypothetical protein